MTFKLVRTGTSILIQLNYNPQVIQTPFMSFKNLTPETQNAISQTTDPYADFEHPHTGFPDGSVVYSSQRRWAKRVDINCPFNLVTGETWDFHIVSLPIHNVVQMDAASITYSTITTPTAGPTVGPITVIYKHYNNAGLNINTVYTPLGPDAIAIDTATFDTQRRFVSFGYELHNTTAELYRSGSLTVYRVNSSINDVTLTGTGDPDIAKYYRTWKLFNKIPHSLAEANFIPGARTWEASMGAYCVSLPHSHNTLSSNHYCQFLIPLGVPTSGSYPVLSSSTLKTTSYSPLHGAGVYSSRLPDDKQTFSLDCRIHIEEVPNPSDPIMSYTLRSPEYNQQFLKIYKMMIMSLPAGTPVRNNASGDWWRSILGVVKDVIPHVQSILPPQFKPIAAALAPVATNLIDRVVKRPFKNDGTPNYDTFDKNGNFTEAHKRDLDQRFLSDQQLKKKSGPSKVKINKALVAYRKKQAKK